MVKKVQLPTGKVIPERRKNSYTRLIVIIATTSIILTVFGWLFTRQESLARSFQKAMSNNTEIQKQLSQIQTDLKWIKRELEKRR